MMVNETISLLIGGSTFCAVASLVLLGCLEETLTVKERHRLAHWCILRQQSGFQVNIKILLILSKSSDIDSSAFLEKQLNLI